jgi:hypothetical protein
MKKTGSTQEGKELKDGNHPLHKHSHLQTDHSLSEKDEVKLAEEKIRKPTQRFWLK